MRFTREIFFVCGLSALGLPALPGDAGQPQAALAGESATRRVPANPARTRTQKGPAATPLADLIDGGLLTFEPFRWDFVDVVQQVPIPGTSTVNNIPVRLHGVVVRGTADAVLQQVESLFRRYGLYIPPPQAYRTVPSQPNLTAYDPLHEISYTALISPREDHTCMVILGEAAVGAASSWFAEASSTEGDFAPVVPHAHDLLKSKSEGVQTMTFSAPMSEDAVARYYAKAMPLLGYELVSKNEFRRNRETLRVSVQVEKGETIVVLLHTSAP